MIEIFKKVVLKITQILMVELLEESFGFLLL